MPVATYRWGQDFFLGVKGGSVGQSHSHMDVGSFVFEAAGERWAVDTGMQDYAGLEAAGVDLWNEREQGSQRWSIFRIGPESHNIPRFGDNPQLLFQHAPLTAETSHCTINLSALYGAPVVAAERRFDLQPSGCSVEDNWTADAALQVTSQWLTFADVSVDNHSIVLRQNGRRLRLEANASIPLTTDVEDFSRPVRAFDAPNAGLKRISFRCRAARSGSIRLRAISD
jgi:hypothetical protein